MTPPTALAAAVLFAAAVGLGVWRGLRFGAAAGLFGLTVAAVPHGLRCRLPHDLWAVGVAPSLRWWGRRSGPPRGSCRA